jgi:hypothetical protein
MCLKCNLKMAEMLQLPLQGDQVPLRKEFRGHLASPSRRRTLDPVRALRIRELLERIVLVGLGPGLFPQVLRSSRVLNPHSQGRGGARAVFARQVAIYLGHVGCKLSYSQVASLYARDRTTAAHACNVVEDRRDDPQLDDILGLLELCIRAEFRRIEPSMAGDADGHAVPSARPTTSS